MTLFLDNLKQHNSLMAELGNLEPDIVTASQMAAQALLKGGKILLCGNGGSAADSQHLAGELMGRFIKERRPLAAIALSTDTSVLTCIGNDYTFDEIFSRQLQGLGRPGDVLIGISTSGNSRNIVRAVEMALKLNIQTMGLLGNDGGRLRHLCEHSIVVPSKVTARIQESHILIGHTICGLIEQELGLT